MGNPSRFCTQCGAPAGEEDLYCARCGSKLKAILYTSPQSQAPASSSKPVAPPVSAESQASSPPQDQKTPPPVPEITPVSSAQPEPEVPKTPLASAAPPVPEAPKASPTPAAPPVPEAPETSSASAAPPVPEAPKTPPKSTAPKMPESTKTPPSSASSETPAKKPSKLKRILIFVITFIAFYAFRRGAYLLISGDLGKNNKPPVLTKSPIVTVAPVVLTKAPVVEKTVASVLTPLATATPRPTVKIGAPDVSSSFENINKQIGPWNYLEATDDEIRDCMTYFWCGTDSRTKAKCAFFTDKNGKRGGYIWWKRTKGGLEADFNLGTIESRQNSDTLVDGEGKRIALTVISKKNNQIDFTYENNENYKGTLRLKKDTKDKADAQKVIFAYKHALERMGND